MFAVVTETTAAELESLGRDAAREVAGADSVEQVEVAEGADHYDSPIYNFTFLIDQSRAIKTPGLLRARLIQKLRDESIARGDAHYPMIKILDRTDWDKRRSARSV